MSCGWAQPTGLSQPLALGLKPWASPLRGLASCPRPLPCPPNSARPGSPPVPSLTFQFSVVQELLIGHCRERRGRGRGLSQGGKEAGERPGAQWGWAGQPGSLCPLLNLNPILPLVGAGEDWSRQGLLPLSPDP